MQDYVAMCPATKCEFAHERCIGDIYRDYNYVYVAVDCSVTQLKFAYLSP